MARLTLAISIAIVSGLVTGCTSTGPFFGGARGQRSGVDGTEADAIDSSGLGVYLDLMHQLVEENAVTRDAAFDAAREAAADTPTTTNRLRYALALSVPGHSGSDAKAATEELSELLAFGNALLPQERILASIQLGQAEERASLEARRDEFAEQLETAVATRDSESADQIRQLESENAKLRTELKDANQMLDAITRIEESISERQTDEN